MKPQILNSASELRLGRRRPDSECKASNAEMDWCRVVGPCGLCRPLDEKHGFPANTPHLAPCKGRLKGTRAGQGRAGSRAGQRQRAAAAGRAQGRAQGRAGGQGARGHGARTLPHRSVETLGRGPRSKPRAPMQIVSSALSSLGFRALGFFFERLSRGLCLPRAPSRHSSLSIKFTTRVSVQRV